MKLSPHSLHIAALLFAFAAHAHTIVPAGDDWKYFDDQAEPATDWQQAGFDDSKWKSGKAPLGYGETRLGTRLEGKLLTAWFRREFDAACRGLRRVLERLEDLA